MSIWVLFVGSSPVKRSGNRPGRGGGGDQRASDKFSRRVGSINESKQMGVNEVIDKVGAKLERAAG